MTENLFKEMSGLLKSNFESSFESMSLFQKQSEKITKMMLDQVISFQSEGRNFIENWMSNIQVNQENYKKMIEGQLNRLEDFFSKNGGK